jgi:16S rRNA (guanine1207-N2)-methyltransferase
MPHYFDPEGSPRPGQDVCLTVGKRQLNLRTSGSVFGRGKLDTGTKVLLDTVPPPAPSGDLLDVGCGYGPIALTMAVLAPEATVWAIDVNEHARRLCGDNAAAAALTNVRVHSPEEIPSSIRFETIWSNPPIRIGKHATHALLRWWLSRLTDDGHAYLVVQKHLGSDSLQTWLEDSGWPTERIASRKGYRVLRCQSQHR